MLKSDVIKYYGTVTAAMKAIGKYSTQFYYAKGKRVSPEIADLFEKQTAGDLRADINTRQVKDSKNMRVVTMADNTTRQFVGDLTIYEIRRSNATRKPASRRRVHKNSERTVGSTVP